MDVEKGHKMSTIEPIGTTVTYGPDSGGLNSGPYPKKNGLEVTH